MRSEGLTLVSSVAANSGDDGCKGFTAHLDVGVDVTLSGTL